MVDAITTDNRSWSPGSYADVVLGLAASDGDRIKAVEALGDLKALAPSWVRPTSTTVSPAAAAKAILAARALQDDFHRFAGLDLERILRDTQQTSGADAGRFGSVTTFGQSLGLLALAGTGSGVPGPAASWLVSRQCSDGGFAPTGGCAGGDPDHTALAAQALQAAGRGAEATKAGDWLVAHQASDGGFGDGSNANSTGLAAEALRALGRRSQADKAANRVVSLQKPLEADATKGAPIKFRAESDGDLLFATTQGVLAFGAPRLDLVRFPDVIGEPCAPGQGVTVVVDMELFDRSVRVGCSTAVNPSGSTALETAGFAATYSGSASSEFGRSVCTIDGSPDPATDPCFATSGYWSYWHADRGASWAFSPVGPDKSSPPPGSVEGWRYEPDFNTPTFVPRAATDWPTVALSGPANAETGTPTEFRATVTRAAAPVTSGTVQLFRGGQPFGSAGSVGGDGVAVIRALFPAPGTSTITARYLGSPTENPRTSPDTINVKVSTGPGYWLTASDGGVFTFGGLAFHGSEGGAPLSRPIVGAAATPSGEGYWLVASDGGIFAHGDAGFFGSLGGLPLNRPIVGMASTPNGQGYWLVASDGGIFAFGDAGFFGSTGSIPLVSPVVGLVATSSGRGYLLTAADGGVFAFGDAGFAGSMGGQRLARPVVAIVAEPGRPGYLLVAADGGVFAFGGTPFRGSTGNISLVAPIVAASALSGGYRFVASDGGVFSFGLPFLGSAATIPLSKPIVGFAAH